MKIEIINTAEYKNIDNLFYQYNRSDTGSTIFLYDDTIKGTLGCFKVWYDSEMENREYITINNEIMYLDTIIEL